MKPFIVNRRIYIFIATVVFMKILISKLYLIFLNIHIDLLVADVKKVFLDLTNLPTTVTVTVVSSPI